jgi:hypothetical protein
MSPVFGQTNTTMVTNANTNLCIPFVLGNTDYQKFKVDIVNGTQLQDANGNVMTSDQITAFIATLP